MKVKLTINGKEHEVSAKEAKRIHSELSELFGKSPVVIEKDKVVHVPYPAPPIVVDKFPQGWSQPYWDPWRPVPMWGDYEVTCQSRSTPQLTS